jgi:hypothetical protein
MGFASRRIIAAVSMGTVARVKSIATKRHAQPSTKKELVVDGKAMEVVWVHVVVEELAMAFAMMDCAAVSMGSVVRVSSIALVYTRS